MGVLSDSPPQGSLLADLLARLLSNGRPMPSTPALGGRTTGQAFDTMMGNYRDAISPQAQADLRQMVDVEPQQTQAPPQPGPLQQAPQMSMGAPFQYPQPMQKPPQPLPDRTTGDVPMMTGVEGGWPLRTNPGSLAVNISGSGHPPAKHAPTKSIARAKPGLSESDLLNMQQLAMILARRQAAGG